MPDTEMLEIDAETGEQLELPFDPQDRETMARASAQVLVDEIKREMLDKRVDETEESDSLQDMKNSIQELTAIVEELREQRSSSMQDRYSRLGRRTELRRRETDLRSRSDEVGDVYEAMDLLVGAESDLRHGSRLESDPRTGAEMEDVANDLRKINRELQLVVEDLVRINRN